VAEAGTTARIRRRPPGKFGAFIQGRLPLQRDSSPPPPPPLPRGDLRAATITQITEAAAATWPQWNSRSHGRQTALQVLLAALEACSGQTWQDRWVSGGFNQATPGQPFTACDQTWIRVFSPADARREREHGRAHVRLRDTSTSTVMHIDRKEERAFWTWAVIETLRLSGVFSRGGDQCKWGVSANHSGRLMIKSLPLPG
jgi:hypothetical protein